MKNSLYRIRLAIYPVITVACLLATDRCVQSLFADWSALRMIDQTGNDGSSLAIRTREARIEAEGLAQELADLRSRTPLTLETLKTVLAEQHLSLRSLARKTGTGKNSAVHYCDTEFTGSIGAVVRLLHEIDTGHTVQIDRVQITPADENGDTVVAHVWLRLSDS